MTRNVGTADRIARLVAAIALCLCALVAPLSPGVRFVAFALPG